MRRLIMLALLPLVACTAEIGDEGAGVSGTGTGTARTFAVTGFTGVALKGSDDVEIRTGSGFSVRAEGPVEALDRLNIVKNGDTLSIGRKSDASFSWGNRKGARIFVTMPSIVAATITGSGDMTIDRARADAFQASTTGSGSLRLAALETQTADLSVTGSGDIAAAGNSAKLNLSIAGSGDIDAAGVAATQAKASIAGSGSIRANINGPATVSILGSGDAEMGANAVCATSRLGSGEVSCGK